MTERVTGVYDYDGPPRVDHPGHIYYEPDILREEYDVSPVPEDRRLDVLVSGGSMGGLFTAHALQGSGHRVDVFERTERGAMRGRGAGIVPDPELLLYMERHGLVEDRDEVSVVMDRLDYLDHDGSVLESRPYRIWSTSWDTFYRPLRKVVGDDAYHMGKGVVDVIQDGGAVTARFEDGDPVAGDLLVAAEGYGSRTRRQFLPDVELQYAGYLAWRGIVPERELPDDLAAHLGEAFVIYHGSDFQILTYPVPGADGSTDRGDRRVNLVWYENVPEGEGLDDLLLDRDGRQREGSLPPGKLHPEVRERQNRVAEETLPEPLTRYVRALDDLYIQCIYDLEVPRMVFDRVCLLGDGAFFVRPHMAAGTSKAAADGFTLAEALSTHGELSAALDAWEASQLELGSRLVAMARERGDRYMARF
jgi:2-polyprenyl-6-methoxyphenol hydroxylase-like FAD-dependent oxidoreductase